MSASLRSSRRMTLCRFLSVFAVISAAAPAIAEFLPVPGREYREYYNPVNPVRGEAIVGLAVVPTEAAQRAGVIQVFFQKAFSGEIVIETATADGRFRGEGVYSGSTKGKEWISLPLTPPSPPNSKEPPRPVNPTLLSIAARGAGGTIYVVRWGEAPVPGTIQQLRLYVNSRRAEMFIRAGTKVVPCSPINLAQSVRFDSYCDVAIGDIPSNGQVVLIRRDQFEEQTQAVIVPLP